MAKRGGSAPISVFVPATFTNGVNKDGKEVIYTHLSKKISTGKGYGITVILPSDTPLTTDKSGVKGAWLQFYVNRPRFNGYQPSARRGY